LYPTRLTGNDVIRIALKALGTVVAWRIPMFSSLTIARPVARPNCLTSVWPTAKLYPLEINGLAAESSIQTISQAHVSLTVTELRLVVEVSSQIPLSDYLLQPQSVVSKLCPPLILLCVKIDPA
jgi:hypothetical protein